MARNRRWRDRAGLLTPLTYLVVVLVASAYICGLSSPYVLPNLREIPLLRTFAIVECTQLPAPLGGNNRSILSLDNNPEALDIDLRLEKSTFASGEAIEVELIFNNTDNGPIILYFNPDVQPPLAEVLEPYTGIMFEIERVGGGTLPAGVAAPPSPTTGTFADTSLLHLLGSRTRCFQEYELDGIQLSNNGLTPGEYRLSAVYSNPNPGVRPPQEVNPLPLTPTPFPEYRADQNVWTGRERSNEVRFTVTSPGVPPG